jgi:hypothetical protein
MDPLDQRIAGAAPAPLSATDRDRIAGTRNILALEARDANERAGSSMGGPGDLALALRCIEAARTLDELLARRGAR